VATNFKAEYAAAKKVRESILDKQGKRSFINKKMMETQSIRNVSPS
jgi:hypothetical protein